MEDPLGARVRHLEDAQGRGELIDRFVQAGIEGLRALHAVAAGALQVVAVWNGASRIADDRAQTDVGARSIEVQ